MPTCKTSRRGKRRRLRAAAAHETTHQVLARISDACYAVDREWRFTYVNEAAELLLGRTQEDLLGKVLWQEFPPTVQTPLYAAFHRALAHGVTVSLEVYYPPWDGWGEGQIYPSPDGISVFFHDVTARKRLDEELRSSEAKYRALVEQLPVGVYLLAADEHATPLYLSPFLEAHMGIPIAEAMARTQHWLTYVHPDDRARVAAADARPPAAGEVFRLEYRHLCGDGSYIWVHDECVPVRDDSGQIIAWQGVLLDITARVEAQAALVASETRFRTAFANAPIGMALVNLDGCIMQVNDALCAMLGYTSAELVNTRVQDFFLPEEVAPSLARLGAFLTGEREIYRGEKRQVRKNGDLAWIDVSISPVRDDAGTPVYLIAQLQDVTERKRSADELRMALEAARDAERARSQSVAVMSHELRTPMQAVLGYSELLQAQLADRLTPEQQADFTALHQSAHRVVDVVNDLLDLSRLNAGRLELVRERVELGPILEQVRQDVAPQAASKGLTLSIDLPASLPTVLADPVRLRHIVLNLVGNAVKFTEEGTVRVSASVTDATLYLSVSDTGIGMAPEVLPLIFDEFFQVDSGLTRRQSGTGLGLAIARKLAEQHGGRITVTSQPAVGSTFTLELPAAHMVASQAT